ncbi:MAG: TonB-dependent receptor family protein [Flavobacteriales bacterium]
MKTLRVGFISAALLCLTGASVFAQDSTFQMVSMWHGIPEATVSAVGLASGASGLDEVPGSLHLITTKELKRFSYTDPLRTLRTVAGVNITEEDGFGLRPNIGLRGSGTERSSRITIMEDGVLIAPAPYTASSAYYFPSIARMSSVEILKGSSQIAFGPQTASGAINLISTQIPDVETASFSMSHGSFKNRYVHMYVGNSVTSSKGTFGYLIEFLEIGSDGFKTLDNDDPTGFIKSDRLAKLKWSSPVSASVQQSLQLKLADVTETSQETYLGLSEVDFAISPFRRYAASAQDVMNTEQTQTVLTHTVAPSKRLEIKTDIYRTTFHRNWYKLDRAVDSTGTTIALGEILNSPDDFSEGYSYLTGSSTIGSAGLDVKANNRNYFAEGIQSRLIYTFGKAEVKNRIIFGSRFHRDLVDRFQWRDRYSMDNGTMELVTPGIHGTAGNRVESASALANYLRATLHFGDFTLTPGLRHENISFERYDYGSSDLERLGNGDYRVNSVSVLLPGVGLNYQISSALDVFTGVHRGFIPPGSKPETEPELSINSELGVRFSHRYVSAQMVIFSNNYSNLLGADLNASGGTGSGDLFNGGSAMANGLEFELSVDPLSGLPLDHFSMPVRIAYTYTDATFTNAFDSDFGAWGDVEVGDALPYLAPHQLSLVTSLEHEKFAIDISGRYTSAMRTIAGQGVILLSESTDESLIFDMGIRYEVSNHLNVNLGVTNLLDRTYAVARRPYGLRPNMPRALRIGVSVNI